MNNSKVYAVIFFFISIVALLISNSVLKDKVISLKEEKYLLTYQDIYSKTKILVDEKKNATLAVAIALSYDDSLVHALQGNKLELLELYELSLSLRNHSDFKNVWLQLIDTQGRSVFRSWIEDKGDTILGFRTDINEMLKNPKVMTTISVGKFDMTFKSIVPIYNSKKLLGMIEVITHFNSIAENLIHKDIEPIIMADKKYKNQLTKPFTKLFIDDYYIANIDANLRYMNFIKSKGVEHFINNEKKYHIDEENGYFITSYDLPDIEGNDMGYIILFKPLDKIDMSEVELFKEKIMFYILGVIILLGGLLYYLSHKNFVSKISLKNEEMNKLNRSLSLSIQEQNSFLSLFDQDNSVLFKWNNDEKWSVSHVSESVFSFLEYSKEEFLNGTVSYSECIYKDDLKRVEREVKSAIEKNESSFEHRPYRVLTKSKKIKWVIDQTIIIKDEDGNIINFIGFIGDISEIKQLEDDNREKEKMLFQQSKMAAMGEMIGNIAHQWRQPIAIISMWSNNIIIDVDMETVNNKSLLTYANNINTQTKHLSQTIDDFRNFFAPNKERSTFTLKSSIEKTMNLLNAAFKTHDIEVIQEFEDIEITSFENELTQAILNVIKNTKDILVTLIEDERRLLFIDTYENEGYAVIEIKDNGGGIPIDIIDKVFEPYFTTKHKSQGTGIGLYMTDTIITKHLGGEISVQNSEYEYEGVAYRGAKFMIRLPIQKRG